MDMSSGPSFLYHLLANELSVLLMGELDQAVENMAPLPVPSKRKKIPDPPTVPVPTVHVDRDAVFSKLEAIGFQVGLRLVERLTKDHPRFKDELDVMKFICTDLWKYIYEKQVDTLRTNNQGTFVLTDNSFRPLSFFGVEGIDQYYPASARFIAYPCGIIRGALSALGTKCTVSAKAMSMVCCVFEVIVDRS
ncbi:trafficking protein particle complex subunit 6b-like [Paramacrobiotus metropolitanus]|uniref:trafficking protein particle complex subunit 6b-like n=1 Tax=Paramacrobiotus metropolitanus TaxID=2943436 RepID=UPI002445ACCA|nr:trafficking protein particle complex subunit 6b-like [Paramacrobiotus metropolitanus]